MHPALDYGHPACMLDCTAGAQAAAQSAGQANAFAQAAASAQSVTRCLAGGDTFNVSEVDSVEVALSLMTLLWTQLSALFPGYWRTSAGIGYSCALVACRCRWVQAQISTNLLSLLVPTELLSSLHALLAAWLKFSMKPAAIWATGLIDW